MSEADKRSQDVAPSRAQVLSFWFRSCGLRALRARRNFLERSRRLNPRPESNDSFETIAFSTSDLYSADGHSATERLWTLGKVENLRRAVRRIDGVVLPPGAVFSFWRQIGPPWRLRGFVIGRELREGCLIPNVGGGLCQLSNALYDCALKAGAEIVERHRHTRTIPGSLAAINRDATVFWNYVDLRFRAPSPLRISARLDAERLLISFSGPVRAREETAVVSNHEKLPGAETCATCGVESCLRHAGTGQPRSEETAVLVDEFWPEFDAWLAAEDRTLWHLATPMRRARWHQPNYAWNDQGWKSVCDVPLLSLARAWRSRRLAAQGAARQKTLLHFDRELARAMSNRLPWRCSHVVVSQTLLPHLHSSGWLGGRSLTVFLTRWPIRLLHQRLDEAAARHPGSTTLADYRADPSVADAEWEALERAESIVTCHARLAEIWPEKTTLLPWKLPSSHPLTLRPFEAPLVVFPASGAARKGVFELREALRAMNTAVRVTGRPQIESDPDFWQGIRIAPPAAHWLEGARVVILPAWIEHRPRRLLEAISSGVPVIASDMCGLHGWPTSANVSIVPCGDSATLIRELGKQLAAVSSDHVTSEQSSPA